MDDLPILTSKMKYFNVLEYFINRKRYCKGLLGFCYYAATNLKNILSHISCW
jgi:hypothetical protein